MYSGSRMPGRANTVSPAVVTSVGYSMPPAPARGVDRRIDDRHDRPRIRHEPRAELLDRADRGLEVAARELALLGARVDADLDGAVLDLRLAATIISMYGSAIHAKSCTSSA